VKREEVFERVERKELKTAQVKESERVGLVGTE